MGLDYLQFNIFGLALRDMATSTGSISERLCRVHIGYFYKVHWERDLAFIPDGLNEEFLQLKKLIHDDIIAVVDAERDKHIKNFSLSGIELSSEWLENISNFQTVLKKMHWKKAKKIAELVCTIYFGLNEAVKIRK